MLFDDDKPRNGRHWTEYIDNSDEAEDRSDDWEWQRQDDWGDPWDHEDGTDLGENF